MSVTTQDFITRIKDDYAPDLSRSKILDLTDIIQQQLFAQDAAQMTWLNGSDDSFPIPFLQTTSGTLEYEISSSTLLDSDGNAVSLTWGGYSVVPRKIKRVFIQSSGVANYSKSFYGERFDWSGLNDTWSRQLLKIRFYEVPGIPFDKTNMRNCTWQFSEDPGTSTGTYYVEFYVGAVPLTSESIDFTIDATEWYGALRDGVVGEIEDIKYGRSDKQNKFRDYWKPRFRNAQQAGMSRRKPVQMPIRECG